MNEKTEESIEQLLKAGCQNISVIDESLDKRNDCVDIPVTELTV